MKTLVYFASGPYREEYQDLDFNGIYLIDNCFKKIQHKQNHIFSHGKVTCIGMDCLESIELLKNEDVHIDCFVSLNEGLGEGGGSYAINSDMFLGYAMPLFKDKYIHIMNKNYYHKLKYVSMDLPYDIEEIMENDNKYLSPYIFSKYDYHLGFAKVYQMTKSQNKQSYKLSPIIKFDIINDSIWNYYEELDIAAILFSDQGQSDFFDKLPKVINMKNKTIEDIFTYCVQNKINKIGFTPKACLNYYALIKEIQTSYFDYPKEIKLFHLNKNNYKVIEDLLSISIAQV